jgi:hypothetical protein
MNLKQVINRSLGRFGYMIVRASSGKLNISAVIVSEPQLTQNTAQSQNTVRSLSLRPAKNEPPRTCNFLADRGIRETDLATPKVNEFHKNGVVVLPTDPDRALHWRQTEIFDRDVSNVHSSWDWAGNSIKPYSSVLKTGMPSDGLKGELLELITSSYYEAFFNGVLGCSVSIGNCRLVKSLPHTATGVGPQSWHEDGCPPGIIRGVLYLTDVNEANGPFQYKDNNSQVHTVVGKTGDLLVFDAMRLPHRAMPPSQDMRMAIDLVFFPRLSGHNAQVIAAGMNHWPADPFAFDIPTDKSLIRNNCVRAVD